MLQMKLQLPQKLFPLPCLAKADLQRMRLTTLRLANVENLTHTGDVSSEAFDKEVVEGDTSSQNRHRLRASTRKAGGR